MSRERYSYASTRVAHRPMLQRTLLAVLLVTGILLLVLAKSQHPATQAIRSKFLGFFSPALSAISQPVSTTRAAMSNLSEHANAIEDNRALRVENDRLRQWQSVAMNLKAENEALRKLMGYQPASGVSYVTARIIGQSPNAYAATLTINAGSADGITSLQPVIDSYGLIGRVTDVAPHTARVLLLSDLGSRVPVITSDSRQHAILSGTGDSLLRLSFLTTDQRDIKIGEQIMTTEEGGLIPGGIAVGQVFRHDKTGFLIKPLRPLAEAEYVRVMQLSSP